MIIYYDINEENHLLTLKWTSKWTLSGYLGSLEPFINLVRANNIKAVISDFRDLTGEISIADLKILMENRPKIESFIYKTVYLIDQPEKTAFVHLYSDKFNKEQQVYFYCITLDKAINILNLPITNKTLELMLNKQENIFYTDNE